MSWEPVKRVVLLFCSPAKIGEGGTGEVNFSRDTKFNRDVAPKLN